MEEIYKTVELLANVPDIKTQKPGGTVHQRHNQLVASNPYSQRLEMMNGTFQTEVFDYDALCKIPVSEIPQLNQKALKALQ